MSTPGSGPTHLPQLCRGVEDGGGCGRIGGVALGHHHLVDGQHLQPEPLERRAYSCLVLTMETRPAPSCWN